MKILITGNMGYVGPGVIAQLRKTFPKSELIGYDTGYFANCLSNPTFLPESKLNRQIFGDVRRFDPEILNGVSAVVYLAAISNDPMGNKFENITMDVNYKAAVNMAIAAKQKGVRSFVFASSCSMYGEASGEAKIETDTLNPLTAYARSKVYAEKDLQPVADDNFTVTCLRFATACGFSKRLRLDLVLNDFVAGAVTSGVISILSDGTPWRPLINVLDMAIAIEWAITRKSETGGNFLAINTGSNEWNYQVKDLAYEVAKIVPGVKVSVNPDAPPDKRSYKVNFDQYKKLAPMHQPIYNLDTTIRDLKSNLDAMNFNDPDYRNSYMIRLKILNQHQEGNLLDNQLNWNW